MKVFVLPHLLLRCVISLIPLYMFLKLKKCLFSMKALQIYEQVHSTACNCILNRNCFSGTFLSDFLSKFYCSMKNQNWCSWFIYLRKIPDLLQSILFLNHLACVQYMGISSCLLHVGSEIHEKYLSCGFLYDSRKLKFLLSLSARSVDATIFGFFCKAPCGQRPVNKFHAFFPLFLNKKVISV